MTLTPARSSADAHRAVAGVRGRVSGPAVAGVVLGLVVATLLRNALPDDGYISLTYARTLVESGTWGLLPGVPSNTQTGPMNVWLLAAGIAITARPVVAVALVAAATLAAAAVWGDGLRRELELPVVVPYVLVSLLATSPLLVSTLGLESFLGAAVLVGVARYAVAGRPMATGALLGVSVLVRPDLGVPTAVLALLLAAPTSAAVGTKLGAAAGVATLVALPWHVFAWLALGGALPDSLFFKTDGAGFPGPHGGDPMPVALITHYGPGMPVAAGVTAVVLGGGLLAAPLVGRVGVVVVAAGLAHLAALAALGTTPYLWYLAPSLACAVLVVALATGRSLLVLPLAVIAVVAGAALVVDRPDGELDRAPMFSNGSTAGRYLTAGFDVGRLVPSGATVESPGEIGTLAFACRCAIVDQFSDPARAASYIEGPLARWSTRFRSDPGPVRAADYRLGVVTGQRPTEVLGSWPAGIDPGGRRWLVLTQGTG